MAKKAKAKPQHHASAEKKGKTLPHAAEEPGKKKPTFCFAFADRAYEGDWGFSPGPDDSARMITFMCEMSALTWNEVRSQTAGQHKKHHDHPVGNVCTEAQQRITANGLDEVFDDSLFRFRIDGTKRLWGFVVDGVFYAVWWDPDHKVYPTEP